MKNADNPVGPEEDREITCDDLPQLMSELRQMARQLLSREGHVASMRTSSLVQTALRRQPRKGQNWEELTWQNRRHFMVSVYRAMKRALVDRARQRTTHKRGGLSPHFDVDHLLGKDIRYLAQEPNPMTEALMAALEQLEAIEPQWAEAIYHHFFCGLTLQETADLMEIDITTLRRWRQRAYDLLREDILETLNGEA